jgi:cell division protease FtsH
MFSIGKAASKVAPSVKVEKPKQKHTSYSEFVKKIKSNKIEQVVISPNKSQAVYLDDEGNLGDSQIMQNQELWKLLTNTEADVLVDMSSPASFNYSLLFLPLLIYFFFRMFMSLAGGGLPGIPGMEQKKVDMDTEIETRFSDVEGIDNARYELEEIVDFLKNPEQYNGSGAKIPKGAILSGLPGTGKTLLARAIAGESSVPFIVCSGSSFVEMFVGVGAKRVRDLFELAKENQPCIVFIDEIDAIGKKRSSNGFNNNEEREQTINQLLTEMDGFEKDTQIVVIAATNRIDILDEALIRPGRFDRKIEVALPSVGGRERILKVHTKDKKLDESVSLSDIAKKTTGFSGADLANLMNECAIRAVRDGLKGVITKEVVEDVFQRLVVGAKGDTTFSALKKELIAYHEGGHAIAGASFVNFDMVRKVSIIPRGSAGGATFFQPREEGGLFPKSYFKNQIKVALGGRAAEEIVYGKEEITNGASADYAQAYQLARQMITMYGFGENNYDYNNLSQESARQIDLEIDALVKECYDEVLALLTQKRVALEMLKNILIEKEIIDGEEVYRLICSLEVSGTCVMPSI